MILTKPYSAFLAFAGLATVAVVAEALPSAPRTADDFVPRHLPDTNSHDGQEITLGGLPAYFAPSPSSTNSPALIFITDVFGWALPSTRLLAHFYAHHADADVFIPDFFSGEHAPYAFDEFAVWDAAPFLEKYPPRGDVARTKIAAVVNDLRGKYWKVGSMGICWGAPGTLWLGSGANETKADAVAVAHPSITETRDYEALTKPVLLLTAGYDVYFPTEQRRAAEGALLAKNETVWSQLALFLNTEHGFTTRGSDLGGYAALAQIDAAQTGSAFFKHWLH